MHCVYFELFATRTLDGVGRMVEENSKLDYRMRIKTPYALRADGSLIHIQALNNDEFGIKCNCFCPECGGKLVARRGTKRIPHFAHLNGDVNVCKCCGGFESSLHKLVKDVMQKGCTISFPGIEMDVCNKGFSDPRIGSLKQPVYYIVKDGKLDCTTHVLDSFAFDPVSKGFIVRTEHRYGEHNEEVRADVSLENSSTVLLIEIYVRHKVPNDKIERIKELGYSAIEFDFSHFQFSFEDESQNVNTIKSILMNANSSDRWWLCNKKAEIIRNSVLVGDFALLSDFPNSTKGRENIDDLGHLRLVSQTIKGKQEVKGCPLVSSYSKDEPGFCGELRSCRQCTFFNGVLWRKNGTSFVVCRKDVNNSITIQRIESIVGKHAFEFDNKVDLASFVDKCILQTNSPEYSVSYSATEEFWTEFSKAYERKWPSKQSNGDDKSTLSGIQVRIAECIQPFLLTDSYEKTKAKVLDIIRRREDFQEFCVERFKSDYARAFGFVWDVERNYALKNHEAWTKVKNFIFYTMEPRIKSTCFHRNVPYEVYFEIAQRELQYIIEDSNGQKHSLIPCFEYYLDAYLKGSLPKPVDPSEGCFNTIVSIDKNTANVI